VLLPEPILELHRQALPQRAVEYGISRRVGEFRLDDGVFVGELRLAMEIKVPNVAVARAAMAAATIGSRCFPR